MNNKTYKIYSLGCKVNQYDSAKLSGLLEDLGMRKKDGENDIVVIYTCSVTGSAIRKNKRMINKARKENPGAKVILAGCWPRVAKPNAKELMVDYLHDKEELDPLLEFIFEGEEYGVDVNGRISLVGGQSRARYFMKVQDGCEQFCSYCVIPYARGKLRSRDKDEVLAETRQALAKGYKEIVLSGIHLGLYGHNTDYKLIDLIRDLLEFEDLAWLRLSSIEVNEISPQLIDLMASSDKIARHLHIPLQAGCDKILKSMNRPYDRQKYLDKIKLIRAAIPEIAITSDVIVGFPGESEQDFASGKSFVRSLDFSDLHVFSFSAHPRTEAYKMPNKVDQKTIVRRADELRQLARELATDYRKNFNGKKLRTVLIGFRDQKALFKTEYFFNIKKDQTAYCRKDIGKVFELDLDT